MLDVFLSATRSRHCSPVLYLSASPDQHSLFYILLTTCCWIFNRWVQAKVHSPTFLCKKSGCFVLTAWYITDRAEKSPNLPYLSTTSIREVKICICPSPRNLVWINNMKHWFSNWGGPIAKVTPERIFERLIHKS